MQYVLDGTKFSVELPSDNDFEFLADLIRIQKVQLSKDLDEWSVGFDTWENESIDGTSYDIEARLTHFSFDVDGQLEVCFHSEMSQTRGEYMGFRPVLFPYSKDSTKIDRSIFDSIPDGTELKMYTLLVNGQPVRWTDGIQFVDGDKIIFTDMYFDDTYLIPWIVIDDVVIAKYNLLYNVSWDDLQKQGFA